MTYLDKGEHSCNGHTLLPKCVTLRRIILSVHFHVEGVAFVWLF